LLRLNIHGATVELPDPRPMLPPETCFTQIPAAESLAGVANLDFGAETQEKFDWRPVTPIRLNTFTSDFIFLLRGVESERFPLIGRPRMSKFYFFKVQTTMLNCC
jgi:hypothetical protein